MTVYRDAGILDCALASISIGAFLLKMDGRFLLEKCDRYVKIEMEEEK